MKDQLFNAEKVTWLAGQFAPPFDAEGFGQDVMARLPALELKARIDWIAECLCTHLSPDFLTAAEQVRAALPPPLDPSRTDDDFGDFIIAPLGEFAVKAGLDAHPDAALDLLEELTQRFSMEWALRPFVNRWPDKTWHRLTKWAAHDNYHVRRLVSEGTRPRLPWGMAVDLEMGQTMPLLDALHADGTRYVTRSVANHLNDITKHDPDLVMDRLEIWAKGARQEAGELAWMTRHALRTLIKSGDARALRLLGYRDDLEMTAHVEVARPKLRLGEALAFTCQLRTDTAEPVLIDYILHFHRPNGRTGRKVFKLKQTKTKAGGVLEVSKTHPLKAGASTFTLYPGPHRLELQVNGVVRAEADFELTD